MRHDLSREPVAPIGQAVHRLGHGYQTRFLADLRANWRLPRAFRYQSNAMLSQAMLSQAMLSQAMLSQAMLSQAMLSQAILVQLTPSHT